MPSIDTDEKTSRFTARLQRPAVADAQSGSAFVVLPREASAILARRGRTTVRGTLNGQAFQATLEPDGQLSHWLPIGDALLRAAGVQAGDTAAFEIAAVDQEPEPPLPPEFEAALSQAPAASAVWQATTTIARVDWIHWITSAKQARTRAQRIRNAVDMLASGKRRVCCFDPSGYYSKALSAPKAADGPVERAPQR